MPVQGSHGPDGLVLRTGKNAGWLWSHVGWWTLFGGLGRSPGLETPLPVLVPLVVRPPDVRLGGTGRLQDRLIGQLPLRLFCHVGSHVEGRGHGEMDVLPQPRRGHSHQEGVQD